MKHLVAVLGSALVSCLLLAAGQAAALDIGPGRPGLCVATLSGPIRQGDADRIAQLEMEMPDSWPNSDDGRWKTVCLDSPGGSYAEGFRIARHFLDAQIGTVVDDQARCLSACALMFMFGTAGQHESNALTHRRLHVGGALGFHQPDLPPLDPDPDRSYSVKDVRAAFSIAIESTLRFLALAARPRPDTRQPFVESDLQEMMLQHEGESFFMIDTLNKAGRWGIELIGFEPPAFSERGFFYACQNMTTWPARLTGDQIAFGRNDGDYSLRKSSWTAGGLTRERYDLQFAGMQTFDCAATVAQHWSGRILPMICGYRESTNSGAGPDDCDAPDRLYSWAPIPPQAMFPASTTLRDLANGRAMAAMPAADPLPNPCLAESGRVRVTNVDNFTSLRKSTSYESEKIDELPLGSEWDAERIPTVATDHPRHAACTRLCLLADGDQPYDRISLSECIADNWMWFAVTGPAGQSGFASAKYLEY